MAGALAAGFVLIPGLGVERSFFFLALLYGGVAALLLGGAVLRRRPSSRPLVATGIAFAIALALFPFGRMRQHYLQVPVQRWDPAGTMHVVEIREGRSETITYLRQDFAGAPEYYKMITNGFSMSGTAPPSRRYMKLYAWFPIALHPKPRRALLISYGVGSTAKALVDTDELERIDIVDISKEILAMSDIVFPRRADHPLYDPRVHVYVEDGRYFLQSRSEQYDIITGEPPPPKVAGVVNLYTREYFELVRKRLAPGGIHTYWLPVHNLTPQDTRAILNAYCDVFPDCSLWVGMGLEWMLMGTRDATGPGSLERFERQWRDAQSRPELDALGIERPEQLGALFMADAPLVRQLASTTPPLTDNYPKRLSSQAVVPDSVRGFYLEWMRTGAARQRFATSPLVQQLWPATLRERTLPYFEFQRIVNEVAFRAGPRGTPERYFEDLYSISIDSLQTLALWHLGINADIVPILDQVQGGGEGGAAYARERGLAALARHDFETAATLLAEAQTAAPDRFVETCRLYALCLAGRAAEARSSADAALRLRPADDGDRRFWQWAAARLHVEPPAGLQDVRPTVDPRVGTH
jgi:spermidine synthase